MLTTKVLVGALLALLTSGSALAVVPRSNTVQINRNKYIVELESLSGIPTRRSSADTLHEFLYASLRKRDVGFEVHKEFNAEGLFVGASLTLLDPQHAAVLRGLPGVKAVRPVQTFFPHRSRPRGRDIVGEPGVNLPFIPSDAQPSHVMTGVDKLHAQNITGKGIKIGIIDTGIDYTHPALGGGFGPGFKVIGGYDFVGDDYNGSNPPVPDDDPMDQCMGHGTHVAGIIGASLPNKFNVSGVAFDASLSAYRIFGCEGNANDDIIIEALLRGVKDGQHILTLSLGSADGWTESTTSVVASRIADSGTIVTISAGNDGAAGAWYSSSPANGISVISVASVDNTEFPTAIATVSGVAHDPIVYLTVAPFNVTDALPIFATSNDTTVIDDACNPLPDNTPDLSPFLTVIRRGKCPATQKLTNAAAKGGKVFFLYDDGSGFNTAGVGNFTAAIISSADGEFLVSQFTENTGARVSFSQRELIQFKAPGGGLISRYSSYGPSNDFFFKPAVAAPGGNIVSTMPLNLGAFALESGTSMACPYTAGSAALLLAAKGNSTDVVKGAKDRFETTARWVPSSFTGGDPLQTAAQQGAGLINVFDAVHATTFISPGELILNDTANFKSQQTFTVMNADKLAKQYALSHVPAGTAITVKPGTIIPATGPVPLSNDTASVSFSETTFTVQPGETQTITATFSLPQSDASTFPLFSGFIQITSGNEKLHVTYIGLAASLKDKQVIDNTNTFYNVSLPVLLDSTGNVQEGRQNYTLIDNDFPTLLFRLLFGTPKVRVDLVDANVNVTGTLNTPPGSFKNVNIVGPLYEFDFVTRNNERTDNEYNPLDLTSTFANGTQIPNGSYRVLLRAVRVTGDPMQEDDYESFVTPILDVNIPDMNTTAA